MDIVRGIPALADTDPAALIGQYSRDLRDFLTDITPIGTGGDGYRTFIPREDRTWHAWSPRTYRQGNRIFAEGGWTNANLSVGETYVMGAVAVAHRPDRPAVCHAVGGTGPSVGRFQINTDGSVNLTVTASSSYYLLTNGVNWGVVR